MGVCGGVPVVQSPKRWLAIAGVTLLSLVAVGGVAIAIYTAWLFHDLPDAGDLVDYRPTALSAKV